jgi:hypothetical protein
MTEPITIERQIAAVRREITMRKRVYPRWVSNGKMSERNADDELTAMEAVLATLERVKAAEKPELF